MREWHVAYEWSVGSQRNQKSEKLIKTHKAGIKMSHLRYETPN